MRAKSFHGRQNIVKILDYGVRDFYKVINQYCSQKGSSNTILGWGNEATFLSIFSQGLNKNNQYCFLQMPFLGEDKNSEESKEKSKQRIVDALLIKRSRKNTLTAIIEAKKVRPYITEEVTDGNINIIKNALENAKEQLLDINPSHIYLDEKFGDKSHVYKIALIFTVLRAKFTASGEGKYLYDDGYTNKEIRDRAKEYFAAVHKEFEEKNNIYTYIEYIHSNSQLDLIREYYGNNMWTENGEKVVRTHRYTYYDVGVQVIVANYQ